MTTMPDRAASEIDRKLHSLFLLLPTPNRTITGTGFVVEYLHGFYIVTCRHLLTQKLEAMTTGHRHYPEEVLIEHHSSGDLNPRIATLESLYDVGGNPRWLEHPQPGVDVVALALANIGPPIVLHPLDTSMADNRVMADPGRQVEIVGYPKRIVRTNEPEKRRKPVAMSGAILQNPDESEPNSLDFTIRASAPRGASGSPVFLSNAANPPALSLDSLASTPP